MNLPLNRYGFFPIVHVVEWGTEKLLFSLSPVGTAMTFNTGTLERQDPNYSILCLGGTEHRVTEPGSCGRSPECSAEPRVILLSFVHLPKGDSPPLRLLSQYKIIYVPFSLLWLQNEPRVISNPAYAAWLGVWRKMGHISVMCTCYRSLLDQKLDLEAFEFKVSLIAGLWRNNCLYMSNV